jgi:hypothetical protein
VPADCSGLTSVLAACYIYIWPASQRSIPLFLRFEVLGEGVAHTLYGIEALLYRLSVLVKHTLAGTPG